MSLPEIADALIPSAGFSPDDELPTVVAGSQRRVTGALVLSMAAGYISTSVPVNLLLATHLTRIAGPAATAAFSIVTGIGGLAALIANPLGGRISDRTTTRFGRRRTWILTGGIGAAILLLAMVFTTQVWQVALAWALILVLVSFQQAANNALAADQIAPKRRGAVSGVIAVVSLGGPVVGFALVSIVASNPVLQWVLLSVLSAAGVVIAVVVARDPQHRMPNDAPRLGLGLILRSYWVSPRQHPAFAWAWAVRFLLSAAWAANTYFSFVLLQRFHVPTEEVSPMILVTTLIGIVCLGVMAWLTGWLSDKIHRQKPFVVGGGIVLAVGLVVMAFTPSIPVMFVGVAIMSLGFGGFMATDFALCIRMLPDPEESGKDFAVLNIAQTLPTSVVPFIAPALLAIGGFPAFFGGLAVLGVLGAIAVIRIPDIGQEGDPRFAAITRECSTAVQG
ncbi:MAG TPA: MFS transporter [Lacisediminihabitans sp.]|uniref:MFS transporter n=1 Tax=Lacisediminihabitans sp. TaxID=2787631 RepID=UPI002EDB51D4